ncbi:hypothetical protein FIV06_14920 [Labrenzia sp. THAF191b]|nr:hypothetical protein FIV06_14920 [Labrenzia sp. THAF191b]QFT05032.1 hypothetical protein FIV05_14915 [Labrenzia sp. THAF191a]QFT16576.1 hypothetical protein FIV03_14930 [Labrenzia sp. THAF187b]
MSSILNMEWSVVRSQTPRIKRPCQRCGFVKPFGSTGKFRLNANGSQLDAWLIYRCDDCGSRWNRAIFERRAVSSLSAELMEALQRNDEGVAFSFACNTTGRGGGKGDADFSLKRRMVAGDCADACKVALTILNSDHVQVRLDKVLAKGLGLSRNRVLLLVEQGSLKFPMNNGKILKRRVPDKLCIELCIGLASDRSVFWNYLVSTD